MKVVAVFAANDVAWPIFVPAGPTPRTLIPPPRTPLVPSELGARSFSPPQPGEDQTLAARSAQRSVLRTVGDYPAGLNLCEDL